VATQFRPKHKPGVCIYSITSLKDVIPVTAVFKIVANGI
jgi:hypothetical protein